MKTQNRRTKKYTTIILGIILMLVLVVGASFAYFTTAFSGRLVISSLIDDMPTVFWTQMGNNVSFSINSTNFGENGDNITQETSVDVYANADETISCTYDLSFVWDSADRYDTPSVELPFNYQNKNYDYEFSINIDGNETNISDLEFNGNKAKILNGEKILYEMGEPEANKHYDIAFTLYNLPVDQSALYKNFDFHLEVDNVDCQSANKTGKPAIADISPCKFTNDQNSDGLLDTNDQVKCGSEYFSIMYTTGNKVTMIADAPLDANSFQTTTNPIKVALNSNNFQYDYRFYDNLYSGDSILNKNNLDIIDKVILAVAEYEYESIISECRNGNDKYDIDECQITLDEIKEEISDDIYDDIYQKLNADIYDKKEDFYEYNRYIYDENSDAYYYLENYKLNLKNLGLKNITTRLPHNNIDEILAMINIFSSMDEIDPNIFNGDVIIGNWKFENGSENAWLLGNSTFRVNQREYEINKYYYYAYIKEKDGEIYTTDDCNNEPTSEYYIRPIVEIDLSNNNKACKKTTLGNTFKPFDEIDCHGEKFYYLFDGFNNLGIFISKKYLNINNTPYKQTDYNDSLKIAYAPNNNYFNAAEMASSSKLGYDTTNIRTFLEGMASSMLYTYGPQTNLYQYVNGYSNYLNTIGLSNNNARILAVEDVVMAVYPYMSNGDLMQYITSHFLVQENYWLATYDENGDVEGTGNGIGQLLISNNNYDKDTNISKVAAIRTIIQIDKDNIYNTWAFE